MIPLMTVRQALIILLGQGNSLGVSSGAALDELFSRKGAEAPKEGMML